MVNQYPEETSNHPFDLIAFDADDTLWHNEHLYRDTQQKLKVLLSRYLNKDTIEDKLYETELRNLEHFGFGIKSFALSMIETAIELTDGKIQGYEIRQIIDFARQMWNAKVELLEHVQEVITRLADIYPLMLLTKGDTLEQETKIARSGIDQYFKAVEIMSQKSTSSYAAVLQKHHIDPNRFMMVGNSLKSDVLPVLELGGYGVYIPYEFTWAAEIENDKEILSPRYFELENIGRLPELIKQLATN